MAMFSLTVNASKVAATLTDYPAYVDLAQMPASFWSTVQNGGGDIRCYADEAKTTPLAREVVSCDTGSDTGEVHVKIPSLTTSTVIWIEVDGSSSEPAVGSTYGRNAVWSNYKGVWHLQTSSVDSSGNFNGTDTSVSYNSSNGKIGNGAAVSSSKIDFATMAANGSVARTITLWIKTSTNQGGLFSYGNVDNNNYFAFSIGSTGSNNGRLDVGNWNGPGVVASGDAVDDGNWHKVSATYTSGATFNSTGIKIYKNGVGITTSGGSGQVLNTSNTNYGLAYWRATNSFNYTGSVDEVRFSVDTKTANWELTEYNNQSDPANFWTIDSGAEEYQKELSVTAEATIAMTDIASFLKAITVTAEATVSLARAFAKEISVTAEGVVSMMRGFTKTLLVNAQTIVSLFTGNITLVALTVTAAATMSVSMVKSYVKEIATTAEATISLATTKALLMAIEVTAEATVSIVKGLVISRELIVIATATVTRAMLQTISMTISATAGAIASLVTDWGYRDKYPTNSVDYEDKYPSNDEF